MKTIQHTPLVRFFVDGWARSVHLIPDDSIVIEKDQECCYVVNDEGQVLAGILFRQIRDEKIEICFTYVSEGARGQGLSDRLFDSVDVIAQERGVNMISSQIAVENSRMQDAALRQGRVVSSLNFIYWPEKTDEG